jgi:integrase
VPLAKQAIRLLRKLHRITGHCRYLFNNGRGSDKPLSEAIFFVMLRAVGFRKFVTPHGFRVLASTWLHEQGWPPDVIDRQMSHLGRDRAARTYNRAEYMPQRRKMMQAWADFLQSLEARTRKAAKAIGAARVAL